MNIYTVAAIGVIGALICVLLKQYRPELALLAGVGVSAFILSGLIDVALDAISFFRELADASGMSALSVRTLLKCVGVCFVTEFASDTCRDAGETALAARVETFGRLAAFAVSIPLLREFASLVAALIKG
ncbi:MAG: stage III sporulation protein AD [Clostridia bacterium]|nr:stage III sporulation protein AD [Clostridia bacterium]